MRKRGLNVNVSPRDSQGSPRAGSPRDVKLDLNVLQVKFDSFVKTSDSMSSILNVKLIKQRFADFQTKLKVWRTRDRFRKRQKKQFKRHAERLNEVCNDFLNMFPNDQSIVHECNKTYTEFQDYLRRQYKNEKNLNNFLIGLPENDQEVKPEEIGRLIIKAEIAHKDIQERLTQFVELVK